MSMPVFVINLHDSVDRIGQMRSRLEALQIPFERFEAVDARKLNVERIQDKFPYVIDLFNKV